MPSGEATSPARECLKGEEIDPTGQAKPCQEGKDLTSQIIQTPFSSSHANGLPQVGLDSTFVVILLAIIFGVIVGAIASTAQKKCPTCGSVVDYDYVGYSGHKAYCHRCKKIV